MDRPNDPFWNDVEDMNDGSMKCKFCGHKFASDTSISSIKWHLSGERGHGVSICGQVPKEVQEAAFLAMRGGNKRHKSIPSSSNVNDYAIPTFPQEQDNAGDAGRMQVGVQGMENTGDGSFQHVDRSVSPSRLGVDAHESRGEAAQGTDEWSYDVFLSFRGEDTRKTITDHLYSALNQAEIRAFRDDNDLPRGEEISPQLLRAIEGSRISVVVFSRNYASSRWCLDELVKIMECRQKTHQVVLPTFYDTDPSDVRKQTGSYAKAFDEHEEHFKEEMEKVNRWREALTQAANLSGRVLHNETNGYEAEFIKRVVSDVACKLGNKTLHIAKHPNMVRGRTEPVEEHDVENSGRLVQPGAGARSSKRLKYSKTRGVPFPTSSNKPVGQAFEENREAIWSLEGEYWTLFKENLGRHIALSDEVEGIAKAIAKECVGLPLGIITIASSLRGVDDLPEWRTTLKKLRELKCKDMDEKVFKVLRVSYDRLDDGLALKQCLLYCALFPEDHMIERKELIGYLIDEGIIKGIGRRQDAFDEGHTMLNRLQKVCLLESAENEDGGKCVKMHDLIRDMAIQILQENSQVIVKAGAQLVELPDAEEWTENLTRVSLINNEIKKIPSSYSPMCPNLSTLLLRQNHWLVFIADSFFKELHGLKVLDLSNTGIEKLPESVSDLVSLTALLLIDCRQLRYVPSLEKLSALKSLDLYETSLEKMPQGMECLSNLRYFRINGCGEKEFPSGILPKLSHLQVFALGEFPTECYIVEGMEVGCLRKLETLYCHFKGFSDFVEYLRSRDGIQSLSTYRISVGTFNEFSSLTSYYFPSKTVKLGNLSINRDRDFQVKFLNGIQGLVCESIDARSLCDVLSLENATELEIIHIDYCDSMESLVSSSWFRSATLPLPSHNGMFSCLKEFCYSGCNGMEKLFPLELLSYLVNLEVMLVGHSWRLEEIIGTTDEDSSTSNPIAELTLPKLKSLSLSNLPELKGICSAKLICNSLEVIIVSDCENLKRMTICLPVLENSQPSPHPSLKRIEVFPKEWWETVVEWEPPNAKEVLRPIVHFHRY